MVAVLAMDVKKLIARLGQENEARRQSDRAELPPDGQLMFDKLQGIAERAVGLIAKRNSNRWLIDNIEAMLLMASREDAERAREKLNESRPKLEQLEAEAEEARQEVLRAEAEFNQYRLELELSALEDEHREFGKRLIQRRNRERERLMRSVDAGQVGAACGKVIGLELRLEDAQKRGDESRQEQLEESLMDAKPTMESFLLRLQEVNARERTIEERYENLLESLRRTTWRS